MNKIIFALGFFDGVHLGHQALLRRCCALAAEYGCQTGAITFDRHPKALYTPQPTVLISSVEDRKLLLHRYGMDHIFVLPVIREVIGLPWREFLQQLLDQGAAGFVCGDDFRFGYKGEGTAQKLQAVCAELGLPCVIIPEQQVDSVRVSSTHIRRLIGEGQMATALKFLGHPYTLTGTVIRSRQLGGRLGLPTASLWLPQGLAIPKFGIYACRALVEGEAYCAVTNVGLWPSAGDSGIIVEAWLPDQQGDLWGRELTLEFLDFLRPERTFPDTDALRAELQENARRTRALIQR